MERALLAWAITGILLFAGLILAAVAYGIGLVWGFDVTLLGKWAMTDMCVLLGFMILCIFIQPSSV